MTLSPASVVVVAVVIIAMLVFLGGCNSASEKEKKEKYKRTCLTSDSVLQRTPVDYAFKAPDYWKGNPHYMGNPANKLSPLEIAPVDFYPSLRQVDDPSFIVQQYLQTWKGCGSDEVYLPNDTKGRYDATNAASDGVRAALDNEYNPAFGPKGPSNTGYSLSYKDPYPADHRIIWDGLLDAGRLGTGMDSL